MEQGVPILPYAPLFTQRGPVPDGNAGPTPSNPAAVAFLALASLLIAFGGLVVLLCVEELVSGARVKGPARLTPLNRSMLIAAGVLAASGVAQISLAVADRPIYYAYPFLSSAYCLFCAQFKFVFDNLLTRTLTSATPSAKAKKSNTGATLPHATSTLSPTLVVESGAGGGGVTASYYDNKQRAFRDVLHFIGYPILAKVSLILGFLGLMISSIALSVAVWRGEIEMAATYFRLLSSSYAWMNGLIIALTIASFSKLVTHLRLMFAPILAEGGEVNDDFPDTTPPRTPTTASANDSSYSGDAPPARLGSSHSNLGGEMINGAGDRSTSAAALRRRVRFVIGQLEKQQRSGFYFIPTGFVLWAVHAAILPMFWYVLLLHTLSIISGAFVVWLMITPKLRKQRLKRFFMSTIGSSMLVGGGGGTTDLAAGLKSGSPSPFISGQGGGDELNERRPTPGMWGGGLLPANARRRGERNNGSQEGGEGSSLRAATLSGASPPETPVDGAVAAAVAMAGTLSGKLQRRMAKLRNAYRAPKEVEELTTVVEHVSKEESGAT